MITPGTASRKGAYRKKSAQSRGCTESAVIEVLKVIGKVAIETGFSRKGRREGEGVPIRGCHGMLSRLFCLTSRLEQRVHRKKDVFVHSISYFVLA